MHLAIEVFGAAGSMFSFDAWCGAIAVHRAAGDLHNQRIVYEQARRLLDRDNLRKRFKREVLMVEEGEYARQQGRLDEAAAIYAELALSPSVAQELLGLLGLGEVQRRHGVKPETAWRALRRSDELGFGYGQVHAAVTLGLAGELEVEEAERSIAAKQVARSSARNVGIPNRWSEGLMCATPHHGATRREAMPDWFIASPDYGIPDRTARQPRRAGDPRPGTTGPRA
jgi:hypothetical protein